MRVVSPPRTMGTLLPAWIWYGAMLCPFRLRQHLTSYSLPWISTVCDSITSSMASPMSHRRTSIPDSLIPHSVASRTASRSGSYMSLNVLVNAQSMIRPLICVPKSNLMTSSLSMTVVSPPLGVQCAAMWFCEHPVGNAMPASSPRASMRFRTESSSVSHTSMSFMPGFTQLSMYFLTSLCTSAHCRTSLYMFFSRRSSSRFSSDVSRHRLSSLYDWISPSGKTLLKRTDTGTEGGEVWPAAPEPGAPPPPAFFFFFFFFFFFLAPAAAAASPPSSASSPDSAAASSSTLSFSSICAAASAASSAMTRGSEPVAGA